MKNTKKYRMVTLVLPLVILVLFVGLFVGSSISRSNLRKELTAMKENIGKREDYNSRLKTIEEKNKVISYIIGSDDETEKLIDEMKK